MDLGAYSSRVTFMLGNAAIDAASKLRVLVQRAVAEEWELSPEEVVLADGYALWSRDPDRRVPIREAFHLAEARFGTLGSTGWYQTPKDVHGEYRGGTIGASPAYSFTAHVAEVDVDIETGVVDVVSIWVAHDCGKALNPVLVEGQMEGSAYMGFAEALMEEQIFKDADHGRAGLHNAPSLLDYRIPTSLDTPELEALVVESIDPEGPYGAKEAGEGPPASVDPRHRQRDLRRNRCPHGSLAVLAPQRLACDRTSSGGGDARQAVGAERDRHRARRSGPGRLTCRVTLRVGCGFVGFWVRSS